MLLQGCLLKKTVQINPSKNNVWNTNKDPPITEIKYINVLFSYFVSTINKNNIIDAIAIQNKIATTIYQSKGLPDFIYLKVRFIQSIDGIRISR